MPENFMQCVAGNARWTISTLNQLNKPAWRVYLLLRWLRLGKKMLSVKTQMILNK